MKKIFTIIVLTITNLIGFSQNIWTTKAPMSVSRYTATAVVDNKIYAISGFDDINYSAINEEYNPATNTWITKAPLSNPRAGGIIASVNNKTGVCT